MTKKEKKKAVLRDDITRETDKVVTMILISMWGERNSESFNSTQSPLPSQCNPLSTFLIRPCFDKVNEINITHPIHFTGKL